MQATRPTARTVAALYLLMGLPGWFNLMYIPGRFFVSNDAAATARNIAAGELLFRFGILSGLASCVGFLLLAWNLYRVFEDVDGGQARLLVIFVVTSAAIGTASLATDIAPLVLLSGADFLAPFTRPQLESLAYGSLRLGTGLTGLNMMFWGLWLFPFGVLVLKCGYIPRLLGVTLIVGCFTYVTMSVLAIVFPDYPRVVNLIAMPFEMIAEFPVMIWLIVRAVRGLPLAAVPPALARA